MGILSKLKNRHSVAKPENSVASKPKVNKVRGRKVESSFDIPEIKDVNSWMNEVTKMAKNGIKEIDEYYDKLASVDDIGKLVINLGMVVSNYLSFRYELINKLSEHMGNAKKAIDTVNKRFRDIDREFIDKVVEVMSRWLMER